MTSPVFISFDGLDGTGKSTQCRILADRLRRDGVAVTTCVDPGGTSLGGQLRELLLNAQNTTLDVRTEALLFMASRAQLVAEVIRPAMARGDVVLSDRFLLANVVYQGHAGGLIASELWSIGRFATTGLIPDLTIIFDLPPEVAAARRNRPSDRMEARDLEFFRKVRAGYVLEASSGPGRRTLLDASSAPDDLHARIVELVRPLLTSNGHRITA